MENASEPPHQSQTKLSKYEQKSLSWISKSTLVNKNKQFPYLFSSF